MIVRLSLEKQTTLEGELLWADGAFLKLRRQDDDAEVVIPKHRIRSVEVLSSNSVARCHESPFNTWPIPQPQLMN